ncbi:MAG: response regulator [Chloroflexi bacterium]|nr:MAG: response regulator [Chloroflexota bacterium]
MESKKLLIIDDDENILHLMAICLQRWGYRVWMASDGKAGLQLAQEHIPDVIILNIVMPGMNGQQVLRELIWRGSTSKVIIETAIRDLNFAMMMIQNGACDYLVQPLESLHQLYISVQRAVKLKEAEDTIRSNNEKISQFSEQMDILKGENEILKSQADLILEENCQTIKAQIENMSAGEER